MFREHKKEVKKEERVWCFMYDCGVFFGFRGTSIRRRRKGRLLVRDAGKDRRNKKKLKKFTDEQATVEKNIKTFDELEFVVFSDQEWTRLHESHSKDVEVNWPDGHYTTGIERHIEDLKAMFVYAPDTSIKVHPVKFGSGEWTSVIGVMTGTFTKPMPIGDGKFIQPTGKKFSLK